MDWCVYIILCSDDSLYTGISNNVKHRFEKHAALTGAKYFRGRKPLEVVYLENGHDKSSSSKREAAIKAMSRRQKVTLIESNDCVELIKTAMCLADPIDK